MTTHGNKGFSVPTAVSYSLEGILKNANYPLSAGSRHLNQDKLFKSLCIFQPLCLSGPRNRKEHHNHVICPLLQSLEAVGTDGVRLQPPPPLGLLADVVTTSCQ